MPVNRVGRRPTARSNRRAPGGGERVESEARGEKASEAVDIIEVRVSMINFVSLGRNEGSEIVGSRAYCFFF